MKKTTTATTTTTKATFSDLLRRYENTYRSRFENETEFTASLEELSTACTFSVLKKLANVGGLVAETDNVKSDSTKSINVLRNALARDLNNLKRLQYAVNNSTRWIKDKNGNNKLEIIDKALYESVFKLLSETLSEGMDLKQEATCKLLSESEKHYTESTFLTEKYTVRQLKRKVYIKLEDSVGGYEDVETCPIKETYRAIRLLIASNRASQIASMLYAYIEYMARDDESGEEDSIFLRMPKYSTTVEITTDINGKATAFTANREVFEVLTEFIEELNLTEREAVVLKLRLCGHGNKAIATYLGVTENSVKGARHRIADKASERGLKPKR